MPQKFFDDTIASRFIKHLLATSYIPLIKTVFDGDLLIVNKLYIYKTFIIQCVESGVLNVLPDEYLYPSEFIYPSKVLVPTYGRSQARFKVIDYLPDNSVTNFTYQYHSNTAQYDSMTHKHLGNYLRYISGKTGIDLMQYYNCYAYQSAPDISLVMSADTAEGSYVVKKADAKVAIVPISFGRDYTIAVDCPSQVLLRCIIYSSYGSIKTSPLAENSYLSDKPDLEASFVHKPYTRFSDPFIYRVETTDNVLLQNENSLYLVIQLPADNSSSIVVLEGNYTKSVQERHRITKRIASADIPLDKNPTPLNKRIPRCPSLLLFNTGTSYAFSDRLIEYLTGNVVSAQDTLAGNIARTQHAFAKLYKEFDDRIHNGRSYLGVWDESITDCVTELLYKYQDNYNLMDHDGNINKDIELLLSREGVHIDKASC